MYISQCNIYRAVYSEKGIEINAWRVTFGLFLQPNKCRYRMHGDVSSKSVCINGLRWLLCLALVLILSGNVETNPGPNKGRNNGRGSNNGSHAATGESSVSTRSRQRTLSSFLLSQLTDDCRNLVGARSVEPRTQPDSERESDMFEFLRTMKTGQSK